jgi:hypothetical protein
VEISPEKERPFLKLDKKKDQNLASDKVGQQKTGKYAEQIRDDECGQTDKVFLHNKPSHDFAILSCVCQFSVD